MAEHGGPAKRFARRVRHQRDPRSDTLINPAVPLNSTSARGELHIEIPKATKTSREPARNFTG
jgi:hypothetical protein